MSVGPKHFFRSQFKIVCNKLECLSLASLSSLSGKAKSRSKIGAPKSGLPE